jgi:CRISPR-associated exonuclease Cas4
MPALHDAPPNVRVGGMLVGYYLLCERKAWLSMRGLWMEQESGRVALGRLNGESSYRRKKKELLLTAEAPEGTPAAGTPLVGKIDWADLEGGVLHETKLSRAAEEAHRWQLRFYLWLLKLGGATRADGTPFRGELNYPKLRCTEAVELRPEHEARLVEIVAGLRRVAARETPPPRIERRSFCKKCAFEELCYA